jgi:hypothetical protein
VFGFLRKKKSPPLTGAPAVRRQKSYSARSGYVYQYFYEGCRTTERDREWCAEYVFDVSADRKTSFPVSVFVSETAVAAWQKQHGRTFSSTERYAIAKIALFQAFDERASPAEMREDVRVRPSDIGAILERLGID